MSPADDIIHVGRHPRPQAVVPRVARLWLRDRQRVSLAFVKPPELALAEQVGLSVVGPDEGRLHSVHQRPALPLHPPVRERSRVAVHGHRVFKDPIFRALNSGQCEGDTCYLKKSHNTVKGTFQSHFNFRFC